MKQFKRSLSLLLAMALLLSMVYAGPAVQTHAASASSYISSTYAANLSVKTTKAVSLMKGPSTEAEAAYTLAANTMLTVKALHKNTSGTYWYEVLYYDLTLYVDATATTLVDHLTGDVTIANVSSPASLDYGQGFPIKGDISSTLNELGTVTAALHTGSLIDTAPVLASSDEPSGNSYSLTNSTVDTNLHFNLLSPGVYTYVVTAEAISYYIDDNGTFATSVQTVVLEKQQCVVTDWTNPNKSLAFGIDISEHNGSINWAAAKNDIDYVILRIGWEYTLDDYFLSNVQSVIANGIPYGVYIYSYAETEAEAIAEANFVVNTLKTYNLEPDLPIWFDFEDPLQVNLSYSLQAAIVKGFCTTVEAAGYQPGLYTFKWIMSSALTDSYFDTLPIWIAQVDNYSANGTSTYDGGLWQWQYSWTGVISGIGNAVDCNYYYAEFPGITSDTSYLSKCTYYPSNLDATVTGAVSMRKYPSTDYSIIEDLAVGTELHITGLYKNSYGNYWYQVEKDGVTGYIGAGYVSVDAFRYDDLSVVDPAMDDLALGSGYYLKGFLHSVYNNMYKVHAKVYAGEDTLADPALSSSATPNAKEYKLNYSEVCDNMIFSDLDTGYYTYEISADVKNYYVSGSSLASESENVVLWTAPFTVGGASIEPPETVVCDHNVVIDAAVAPTCTSTGLSEGSHCSKCGVVFAEQTVVPVAGHSYASTVHPATCQEYEWVEYVCTGCGDRYSAYSGQTDWVETMPDDNVANLETKTQYRYSDYEKITSNVANLAGYTSLGMAWEDAGTSSIQYVTSWPSGFDKTHTLYGSYNKTPVTAGETTTTKTVVNTSNKLVGHIFWHWCYGTYTGGPTNRTTSMTQDDIHTTFHAFMADISTVDPSTLTAADDGSVTYAHADGCTDSWWWYYIPVYEQTYTTYKAVFTYERWTDWSDWSDTAVTATDTRKVETRTLYRYLNGELGDHSYANGVCTLCGEVEVCTHPSHDVDGICAKCGETVNHSYVDGVCGVCGKTQLVKKVTPVGPVLSFKDEARMKIYFTVENLGDVALEDMGLLTWTVPQVNGTINTAQAVISGATSAGDGLYWVTTNGISAKKLGDTIYFKVYAKLADGSYVYSSMLSTSPKTYALSQIENSTSKNLKALCVALLNYGAAAQEHFGYKTYDLMNASLTNAQRALVQEYSESLVTAVPGIDSVKAGSFIRDEAAFSGMAANVNFGSAFAINYYFAPAYEMDGDMTLYYWSPDTVDSVSVLTAENATGSITMELRSGQYWGDLSGISARLINQAAYVAGVYVSNGVTHTTGILPYSLGQYCKNIAANENEAAQNLAMQTAVYGYYAKIYFGT